MTLEMNENTISPKGRQSPLPNVKLCQSCNNIKPLDGGFYKAGNSYQKRCKLCHNKKRLDYPITPNKNYERKPTGFIKLPEDLRNKIIYDIYVRVNFKDITKKYIDVYPKLNHQSLLRWNRAGQIPKYGSTGA